MRKARVNDHWRRVQNHFYPNSISDITLKGISGFEDIRISFNSGINAICGPNGAGKTTFINTLHNLLTQSSEFPPRYEHLSFSANCKQSAIDACFEFDNGVCSTSSPFENAYIISPSSECVKLIDHFNNDQDLESLLESTEPKSYSNDELRVLSFILGKQYEMIECYEIEDIYGRDSVPYFNLISRGTHYSSLDMGLGELCVFYILWYLLRLDKCSIVFIEEIESHLSPNSQRSLMDYIAKLSDEKKLFFILSTHSPEVLNNLPLESIKLLLPRLYSSEFVTPHDKDYCLSVLGLKSSVKSIVFIEDYSSFLFLKLILSFFEADRVLDTLEAIITGGDGTIKKILKLLPSKINSSSFIGLYDGDLKNKEDLANLHWPTIFLPTNKAPDLLFKDMCYQNDVLGDLAKSFERDVGRISRALASCSGTDHHDWLSEFSDILGLDEKVSFLLIFNLWIKNEENHKEAAIFLDDFLDVLNV